MSAGALAAGVMATWAAVYSQNIVGYVNQVIPNNYVLLNNPLDNGTNDLNSLLGTLPNKSTALVWNGSSFAGSNKGGTPSVWTPDLVVPVGTGFFVKLNTGSTTNTFVGTVIPASGASNTNALPASYALVGSSLPIGTDLNDTNNAGLGLSALPNKSTILVWNGSSYIGSNKGGSPSVWTPDLQIGVGQGFFIQSKTATNWVQSMP